MQLNIHDSTLKRIGFINNDLPDALHYFNDNWHRYLAEGTSTFDFSVNKVNPDYALLTLQSYISFSYDDEDYLFNIINIQQDHYSMQLQCENLNLELISEDVEPYNNNLRHSIVWYLKNAAKITADVVEIGNNPFSTIDEDKSNPILSFDSTETKLARIISICNSFQAEFQFKTNLKNDGTLQNITLDLYQTGGVGQLRKDVTLYYGKNIDGITSTGDRTSTFFNSTTVTDSNNKYNWLSIEGKYYNSDGQLEFYKDAGSNTAYAPLSRDMFPSQILSTSSDQYTNKNIQTSASSNDDLWDYAVRQFKLYAYPQMTYEVVVSVNAVTSALGNDKKLNIGDTIIVQDSTFDKSDGGLILSARVSEQEISFTNPLNNKITFTNFVKLKSEISADLYGRMKDLVDQNTPYKAEVETTNGLQFKNGKGSTTLTARIYFGSDSTETKADSYEWRKDGTLVANVQEITVDASGIDGKAVYAYKATVNEKVVGTASVTITNVNDGERGPQGLKGDPGATGKDGIAGKDGVGIKTTVITYAISTSGTTAPTTGWTSQVPTLVKGQYLWTKTVWTYSDTTSEIGYTVTYIAKDGNNGNDGIAGKDGVGINKTTITYAVGTSGTTAPASGWNSQVPNVPAGQYLWTKTVWDYTDKTSETGYSVSKFGEKGPKGDQGIQGIQGVDGRQGIPGPKGTDGKTQYTHIAYANSADGVTDFSTSDSNRTYIGMCVNFFIDDSTTPSDYSWTLVKGADGTQGTPGKPGADGKIPYFHTAWSYSADGTDGFTTVYPNLNLLEGTKDFSGSWERAVAWANDGTYKGLNVKRKTDQWQGIYKIFTAPKDGVYTFSAYVKSSGNDANIIRVVDGNAINRQTNVGNNFDWLRDSLTVTLKAKDTISARYEISGAGSDSILWTAGHKWEEGSTVTDGLTSNYPNLNLLEGSKKYTKDNPKTVSSNASDGWVLLEDVHVKNLKAGTYTMSGKADVPWAVHDISGVKKGKVGLWLVSTTPGLNVNISLGDTVPKTIEVPKDGDYCVRINTYSNGKDIETHKFWDFKLEQGSIATTWMPSKNELQEQLTPWMPSLSEVTTADYPSYIGQYTDFTQADSTKPSDYTWSLIRGNDGKDGATGKDGVAGKDGVGIKTTVITYAISTSGTVAPTTDWTSTVPTVEAGSYLWTKTVWTYTDNSFETGYSVGKMGNTGPAGSTGNPGKIVSDTEPTTKFKGLTWKYIGITAINASDRTNIQPNTEYYWNGKNWVIYLINAQNIDVEKLTALTANLGDATAGSLTVEKGATGGIAVKDGLVKSWDVSKMTDSNYPYGYSYTSMGVALNSGGLTFYSAGYGINLDKGGVIDQKYEVASLQAIASNGRNSGGTGLVLNATDSDFPFTINGYIDVIGRIRQTSKTTSVTIGAGLTLSLERRGETVIAILDGEINSSLYPGQPFIMGQIPLGYQPNRIVYIPLHMAATYNSAQIDVGIDGVCTWWGPSTDTGDPRGTQMWFTDDPLPI